MGRRFSVAAASAFIGVLSALGEGALSAPTQHWYANHTCAVEIQTWLTQHEARSDWRAEAPISSELLVARVPTRNLGAWIEARYSPDLTEVTLAKLTPEKTRSVVWTDGCASLESEEVVIARNGTGDQFTDARLATLLKSRKSGILYIWSPAMVYSGVQYVMVERLAKQMKLIFIPLLTADAPPERALATAKANGFPMNSSRVASLELEMRDSLILQPTALVFSRGQLCNQGIVGPQSVKKIRAKVKGCIRDLAK